MRSKEMEEIGKKLDDLLTKAGQANKYQILMGLLFSLEFTFLQFCEHALPFLEGMPYVHVPNEESSVRLTYEICQSEFTIDDSIKINSIVKDFGIYCEREKVYLINISIYAGMILGSCLSYLFADKIGRKTTLYIFIPLHILFSFFFEFTRVDLFKEGTLYFLYSNLFLLGFCAYVTIITMIIYICEITKQSSSPLFVTVIIFGMPLSGLLSTLIFNFTEFDWRHIVSLFAFLNIILFIVIYYNLCGSPIYALNNEEYPNFAKYLIQLSNKNGRHLVQSDFNFLSPYMSIEERRTTYEKIEEEIKNNIGNDLDSKLIPSQNDQENRSTSENSLENRNSLKDDYLIDYEKNEDQPVLSLFGKLKMKDYSPLDLIRFHSQIKNFFILSFLWGVNLVIKNGINLTWKNIPDYKDYYIFTFFMYLFEYIGYYCVFFVYSSRQSGFHKLLVSLQLLSFISLTVSIFSDKSVLFYFILLLITKILMSNMFLILTLITSSIYPMMLRTKGLGWNIAFGIIGSIITSFLVEHFQEDDLVLYFLVFLFFSLTFSYGLPNKIGNMILDVPYKGKEEEQEYGDKYSKAMNVKDTENLINDSISMDA